MPGLNISRTEAAERSSLIATESYEILIDVCHGSEVFISRSKIKFTGEAGANTFIDADVLQFFVSDESLAFIKY